ncbi:tetratricopeptide repeat protein [Actinoplanes sp. DH11]|uniref:tetratricopeptide repeat protein n=1 Tax=Actinoplanes sp. DH11 TaxID=2857011 RepID=UPI001E3079A7|nr:tetratricopeptide repeat protein [Actinoplanes sp. DH11]
MTPAARARVLADLGRLADAETEVRAGLVAAPSDPELLALLAGLLRLRGRRDEALRAADAAVRAAPDLAGTHIERAECLLLIPAPGSASRRDRPSTDEEWAPAGAADNWARLGVADERARLGEAVREAEEAVRLEPGHAPAHRVLARALAARRQFGPARAAVRRALELDPRSVPDLLTLAEIERHAGRRKAARAAAAAALAQDPGNPDGRWLIALLDAERLRVRASMTGLRALAADHPDRLDITALTWPIRGLLGGLRRGLGTGVPLVTLLAAVAHVWPSWQLAAHAIAATVALVMIGFSLRVLIPAGVLPWRCLNLLAARTRRAVATGWGAAGATVALLIAYGLTTHPLLPIAAFVPLAVLAAAGRADRA